MSKNAPIAKDDTLFRTEILVNQATHSSQDYSTVAALGDERFVAVWDSRRTEIDPIDGSLLGRVFSNDGTPVGDEFNIAQHEDDDQFHAHVFSLSDGSFLVRWTSRAGFDQPHVTNLKVRIFDRDGQPLSDEFRINQTTNAQKFQLGSDVVEMPDGRLLTFYMDIDIGGDQDERTIFARMFDKTGQAVSDAFKFDLGPLSWSAFEFNVIAEDRILLTWVDYDHSAAIEGGILTQVFDFEAAPVADAQFTPSFPGSPRRLADSLVLENGSIFQTWWGNENPAGDATTARIVLPNGTVVGDEFQLSDENPGSALHPRVEKLTTGQFVVVWWDQGSVKDPLGSHVKARVFNNDGTPAGDEFLVNEEVVGDQRDPTVAALPNGQFVVSWHSEDGLEDRSFSGVKARIFNADGTPASDSGPPAQSFLTNEDRPKRISPEALLQNDTDPDGDLLSLVAVSETSALGARVRILEDGMILYDPTPSAILDALSTGEILEDSFTYRVSDGTSADTATASLAVAGVTGGPGEGGFAVDDDYELSAETLLAAGATTLRLGGRYDGKGLLANEPADEIVFANGAPIEPGVWFDGNGGGQFRIFPSGVVEFRNRGEMISPGDTTGFAYIARDNHEYDSATVTVNVAGVSHAVDDEFSVLGATLSAAGRTWFRLGAKDNNTDLLENDLGVDEIVLIDDAALQPGVWFDGDAGGQFRVFAGGVVDFRNQGDPVSPGDETGFSYSGYDAAGELATGYVTVAFDAFDLI